MTAEWQDTMRECEAQMYALAAIIGSSPESPLQDAVYRLMGAYTRSVSAHIGCNDEWLEAWWLDHNFGEKPMRAGLADEELRDIGSLDDLLALVADDDKQGAQ